DRPIAIAHARAVGQEDVAVGQMRVGVKRNRADLVRAFEGGTVQRLDVRQHVLEFVPVRRHGAARQAVEHERVVRIRAVRDVDLHTSSSGSGTVYGVATRLITIVRPKQTMTAAAPMPTKMPLPASACVSGTLFAESPPAIATACAHVSAPCSAVRGT